jgi:tRNA(Arg) A34 adenosine deaminase TadA
VEFVLYRVEAGFPEGVLYIPKMPVMQRAFDEAQTCIETGDHPVGAVVARMNPETDSDLIVAVGKNEVHVSGDPTAHAEIGAINRASAILGRAGLAECVLYTSHECCPMCSGAVANSKLAGVVYSTSVDDITSLLIAKPEIKWRSSGVRMVRILAGRHEQGVPGQFIIGGFRRDTGGMALLEMTPSHNS